MTPFLVFSIALFCFAIYGLIVAAQERRKHLRRQEAARRAEEALAGLKEALGELNAAMQRFTTAVAPTAKSLHNLARAILDAQRHHEVVSDRSGNPVFIHKSFHRE